MAGRNSAGAGSWSPVYSFSTPTGVSNEKEDAFATGLELQSIYPNPAGDHVWIGIEVSPAGPIEATVVNVWGQTLIEPKWTRTIAGLQLQMIDTSELTPGVYFLTVSDGRSKSHRSFVIGK